MARISFPLQTALAGNGPRSAAARVETSRRLDIIPITAAPAAGMVKTGRMVRMVLAKNTGDTTEAGA